jgi:hypothetical protein
VSEEVFSTSVLAPTRAQAVTEAIGQAADWWDVPVSNCTAEVTHVSPYMMTYGAEVVRCEATIEVRLVVRIL